jgi:HSP20 family protein
MNEIDHAIGTVDRLYRAVTGRDAPELTGVYAAIPAEKDPIEHVNEQIELLARALGGGPTTMRQVFTPPMSVWTGAQETVLAIDLAGVRRDELQLTVKARVLIVTGTRSAVIAREGGPYRLTVTEHPFGAFERRVPLPPHCRVDEISARLHDGLLEVRLPHEGVAPPPRREISIS